MLRSPVTAPARVICQGANYRQHMIESGVDPEAKRFNMFFEKSDAAIHGPVGSIVRPAHVRLLDYEIELALVVRKPVTGPVTVTPETLHEYVFGLTIANDVSARDVQLPEMQFFKGKSYRGSCPLGPYLAILEPLDVGQLDQLMLTLEVNGNVRQRDSTRNLVYKPAETITELSTFSDLSPGAVLLTGTPAGCALRAPRRFVRSPAGRVRRARRRDVLARAARGPAPYRQRARVRAAGGRGVIAGVNACNARDSLRSRWPRSLRNSTMRCSMSARTSGLTFTSCS